VKHPVYTYYVPIGTEKEEASQTAMIHHWRSSWATQGWEAVVLGIDDAEAHPFFEEYNAAVQRLPTTNSQEYEMACYHRWLAVAHRGGGFMSDYDVVNYSFSARPPHTRLAVYEQTYDTKGVTPSVVGGDAAGFYDMCLCFATCDVQGVLGEEKGRPHTSDMIALQKMYHRFAYQVVPLCKQYGVPNWEDAPLVHFSHHATSQTDRVACMKTSRPIS
jgi:hypothetical protein